MKSFNERHIELEKELNYIFKNKEILVRALTHSSYSNEMNTNRHDNNERFEFLGDAVLELIISEYVYREFPDSPEGELTKTRAGIVCEKSLAYCAKNLSLGDYILLGKGEDSTGGRQRESILADTLEAIIGSIYLDGGFTNAKEFIEGKIIVILDNKELFFDSKTILQEMVQSKGKSEIQYQLILEEGPDHNKTFTSAVFIDKTKIGIGRGRTKKAAEQVAANQAILILEKQKIGDKYVSKKY